MENKPILNNDRERLISSLETIIMNSCYGNTIFVSDVSVNTSEDGNGEDIQVESITYDGTECGVYLDNYDFYPLSELTYSELKNLYDDVRCNG